MNQSVALKLAALANIDVQVAGAAAAATVARSTQLQWQPLDGDWRNIVRCNIIAGN